MSSLNNTKTNGKTYWRSTEELEGTPEFQESVYREFPEGNFELSDAPTRRGFMKAMAASVALAGGMTSCRRPEEKIMPYGDAPEDEVPGKSVYVATSSPRSRGSIGLMVKRSDGRPTKIEGLKGHPANNGSTDSLAQADLLDLYNPYRQNVVKIKGYTAPDYSEGMTDLFRSEAKSGMKLVKAKLAEISAKYASNSGAGLAFLSSAVCSPTQLRVQDAAKKALPEADWYTWEAVNNDNSNEAVKSFGASDSQVIYDLKKAERILSLDSDFMMNEFNSLQMTQDFAEKRRVYREEGDDKSTTSINRFYAVEGAFTLTGSNADHRLRLQSSKIVEFAFALAKKIAEKVNVEATVKAAINKFSSTEDFGRLNGSKSGEEFLNEVAADLLAHKGKSAIIVGQRQPVEVHLLALVLNQALGNIGSAVKITERAAKSNQYSISDLTTEMRAKNSESLPKISTLVILDGNPVYDAPADLKFAESLKNVGEVINLTLFPTETSTASSIVIPKQHYLESWGDTRSADGTLSFVQPLIAPLYESMTAVELIATLSGQKKTKTYHLVKETHGFDKKTWEKTIQKGFVDNSSFKNKPVSTNLITTVDKINLAKPSVKGIELIFASDYSTFDGSYSNNGWMQELPDPITKLTWDNAALISFGTAKALGVNPRDNVKISANGTEIEVPAWIVPGMADDTVVLTVGYGRKELGEKGEREYLEFAGRGFDAYPMRTEKSLGFTSCSLAKGNGKGDLVTTQDHGAMEDRDLVKEVSVEDFNKDFAHTVKHNIADHENPRGPKMYNDRKEFTDAKYQWAMVIDLNSCTGCSACTIACQAENNIPVVGKERVREGREMHWIRMDRYFFTGKDSEVKSEYGETDKLNGNQNKEDLHDLEVGAVHQPIPCMQCEEAPCEEVCPVAATQHSPEGLNDMVYNRCIGTRYCLNNCPYKVRRYNYFNFREDFKQKKFEVKRMVFNPHVTVRSRGVMEKCTYCVQRISQAKIDTKVRTKSLLDNGYSVEEASSEPLIDQLTTACAQVCPTNAITFGDKSNEKSAVSKMRKETRQYTLLPHLNVRPRTSFLAKINNENKALVSEAGKEKAHGHGHDDKSKGEH